MNVSRRNAAVTVLNGYIYIAGGLKNGYVINSVEIYDPQTDEWSIVKPMNKPRYDFALIASKGFLYAMASWCVSVVERFHPYTNCWTMVCVYRKLKGE